jgi:hypothetical protein
MSSTQEKLTAVRKHLELPAERAISPFYGDCKVGSSGGVENMQPVTLTCCRTQFAYTLALRFSRQSNRALHPLTASRW